MVADAALDLADRRAKALNILYGQGRQQLHDREPAEPGGVLGREGRQLVEGLDLRVTVQPGLRPVVDDDHPPVLGKGEAADDRRRQVVLALAAVQQDAALQEGAQADARSRAAVEQLRQLGRAGGEAVELADGGPRGQGELRA